MLVLGRKVGEQILIGENIRITVLDVKGDRIRLGFEAGKEIPIHRAEVARQLKEFEAEPPCAEGKRRQRSGDCRNISRDTACTA